MKVRTKTLISIVLAFLLISLATGVTYYYLAANRFRREAEEKLALLNKSYADQINLKLENYSKVVRDYASQVLVATYIPDLFQESKRTYPELGQFFYTSLDGKVAEVFPYCEKWDQKDFSGYDFWKKALNKNELVIQVDDQTFQEPVLVFSLPILSYFRGINKSDLHGVLCITLPLNDFLSQYKDINVGQTGTLFVLDKNRIIRSHSKNSDLEGLTLKQWCPDSSIDEIIPYLGGRHFGSGTFFKEKKEYFATFYPIESIRWSVLLIQTVNELNQEMFSTFFLIILVFLMSVILAVYITSRLVSRITQPLQDNLNVLRNIAEGKGDFKGLQSIATHDEFEELSNHFQTIFTRMDEVAKDLDVNLQREKQEKTQTLDELEDTQRRFKAIFNRTYQFMFLINTMGDIVEVNDAYLNLSYETRYGVTNTPFWSLSWWDTEKEIIQNTVSQALEGRFVRREFSIRGKDDSHIVDFTLKPIRNNREEKVIMLLAEGRDITDRKKLEKELEEYKNHLEVLVEKKTSELETAHKELIIQSKFATLGKLTAVVSHEIRNPLATIRSSSYVLKQKLKEENEKTWKVLDRIERNVHRCDTIIEDLLSFTRETKLEGRVIPIDEWIITLKDKFSDYHNVTMEYQLHSEAKVKLDTERFRRVIINLVENAVQAFDSSLFTGGRDPQVIIKTEKDGDFILLYIIDNGPGIPEENKDKIFEPLFSTKSFGIGLGLPIVRQLIEKHDGQLTLDSTVDFGTTFTISLPLVKE